MRAVGAAAHRLVTVQESDPPAPRAPGLSLKGRALRYLSAREHSRAELVRKLAAHAETPEQLSHVLDELQAKDFISEVRVADSVVNRRAAKFGAARIRHELQRKGLSAELIASAVGGLKTTELSRARAVWHRKFTEPASDAAGRAKQMRFLAARGFGTEVIRRVVAGSRDEEEP